jgi:hypothetical protein
MKQNAKEKVKEAETKAETQARENPDVVIVKTATAPKLSPRGDGGIAYQIGRVGDAVYVRIEKNDGGGSHSKEFVGVPAIQAAVTPAMRRGAPFKSDALASAFVGKSQCNSGFLVAALRAEGLFQADAEHKGMSKLVGDLDAWERSLREMAPIFVEGVPATVKLHPEPKDTRFRPKRIQGVETPDGESPQSDPPSEGDADAQDGEAKPKRRLVRVSKRVAERLGLSPASETAPADAEAPPEDGGATDYDSD